MSLHWAALMMILRVHLYIIQWAPTKTLQPWQNVGLHRVALGRGASAGDGERAAVLQERCGRAVRRAPVVR